MISCVRPNRVHLARSKKSMAGPVSHNHGSPHRLQVVLAARKDWRAMTVVHFMLVFRAQIQLAPSDLLCCLPERAVGFGLVFAPPPSRLSTGPEPVSPESDVDASSGDEDGLDSFDLRPSNDNAAVSSVVEAAKATTPPRAGGPGTGASRELNGDEAVRRIFDCLVAFIATRGVEKPRNRGRNFMRVRAELLSCTKMSSRAAMLKRMCEDVAESVAIRSAIVTTPGLSGCVVNGARLCKGARGSDGSTFLWIHGLDGCASGRLEHIKPDKVSAASLQSGRDRESAIGWASSKGEEVLECDGMADAEDEGWSEDEKAPVAFCVIEGDDLEDAAKSIERSVQAQTKKMTGLARMRTLASDSCAAWIREKMHKAEARSEKIEKAAALQCAARKIVVSGQVLNVDDFGRGRRQRNRVLYKAQLEDFDEEEGEDSSESAPNSSDEEVADSNFAESESDSEMLEAEDVSDGSLVDVVNEPELAGGSTNLQDDIGGVRKRRRTRSSTANRLEVSSDMDEEGACDNVPNLLSKREAGSTVRGRKFDAGCGGFGSTVAKDGLSVPLRLGFCRSPAPRGQSRGDNSAILNETPLGKGIAKAPGIAKARVAGISCSVLPASKSSLSTDRDVSVD